MTMQCVLRVVRMVRRSVVLVAAVGVLAPVCGVVVVQVGAGPAAAAPVVVSQPGVLSAGTASTCIVPASGGIECWGYNGEGALGDGSTTSSTSPVAVHVLTSGVTGVATGFRHTCAVTSAGAVYCWGGNGTGGLGDGTNTSEDAPIPVPSLTSGVSRIVASTGTTCALLTDGGVKCWGFNPDGQLGDGTTTERLVPVDVSGLSSGISSIAAGGFSTCAVTTLGGVKCWGANSGQSTSGTSLAQSLVPADVAGLTNGVTQVAVGTDHSCALLRAGSVECWGTNFAGQLGDGTTTDSPTPVAVAGLPAGIVSVAVGDSHSCAITAAGAVLCWGENNGGQLGDGQEPTSASTPVAVTGLSSGVVDLSLGTAYSCAVVDTGSVACWGDNSSGQLGIGETSSSAAVPDYVSGSFFRPECAQLHATAHTSFTMTDGYGLGSMATFKAAAGYELVGTSTLTCEPDATWNGVAPTVTPAPTHVAGTVTGGSSPLAGISVRFYDATTDSFVTKTTTATDGTYAITSLLAGTYKIEFTDPANHWAPQWYPDERNWAAATPISVAGGTPVTANAALTGAGVLRGRATGLVDSLPTGVGLLDVRVYDAATGTLAAKTTTGADGSYSLVGLAIGDYKVRFSMPILGYPAPEGEWQTQWYTSGTSIDSATPIAIGAGTTTTADISLSAAGIFRGDVLDLASSRPELDDFEVRFYDAATGAFVAKTFTDTGADQGQVGEFDLDSLPPGNYKVRFGTGNGSYQIQWYSAAGGAPTFAGGDVVTVTANNAAFVEVFVQEAALVNGVVTGGSAPLGGLHVRAYNAITGVFVAKAVTASDGTYTIGALPPGTYKLRVDDPNGTWKLQWYVDATSITGATSLDLEPGPPTEADLALTATP